MGDRMINKIIEIPQEKGVKKMIIKMQHANNDKQKL